MGTFAYIARNPSGERVTGKLAGASEQAILAELYSRNLAPVTVKPIRESKPLLGQGISTRKLAGLYRQMASM